MKLPEIRNKNIVVQNLADELLVFDLLTHKAFCLNETAKIVFNACDGKTSTEDLLRQNKQLNEGIIQLALEKLSREDLLTEKFESELPRRTLLKKAALTAIALPIISVVVAPMGVEAQSCDAAGIACVSAATCCAGLGCQNVVGIGVMCCTPPGGGCTFPHPELCCSGCCAAAEGGQVCC